MYTIQKLKPDRDFTMLLVPFAILVAAALIGALFELQVALYFLTLVFWLYALYSFITFLRTKNSGFVVASLYQTFASLVIFSRPANTRGRPEPLTIFFVACMLFFIVWLIILTLTKRIKWRGREVLELAAIPVEDVGNGYTSRPLPAGKTELTQDQFMGFAEFALKNLIAVTYVGKDKVVFVPVMMGKEFGFIMGLKNDYTDETWVAFDFEGNVSVNISHRDYLNYKEALSFDQLCESMGNLFIEFVELFLRGEGVRIIDRMDAVGISYFS
jgi:hypothetical protein